MTMTIWMYTKIKGKRIIIKTIHYNLTNRKHRKFRTPSPILWRNLEFITSAKSESPFPDARDDICRGVIADTHKWRRPGYFSLNCARDHRFLATRDAHIRHDLSEIGPRNRQVFFYWDWIFTCILPLRLAWYD